MKNIINTSGFVEIENYISENELQALKKFIDTKLKENQNQYFFLTSEGRERTLLNDENFFKKIEELLKKTAVNFGIDIDENEELIGDGSDLIEEELTPPVADTLPVMRSS
mgnify:CR=1 FL=1